MAFFKKNISWKHGQPKLENNEHTHYFHTSNSSGIPQEVASMVAGHTHKVTWDIGPDGIPVAKCGPAIFKDKFIGKNGMTQSRWSPVKFFNKFGGDDEATPGYIVDDHTHEIEYKQFNDLNVGHYTEMHAKTAQAVDQLINDRPEKFDDENYSMKPAGPRKKKE